MFWTQAVLATRLRSVRFRTARGRLGLICGALICINLQAQAPTMRSVANSVNTIKNASFCPDTSITANTITCSTAVGFVGYVKGQTVDVLLANSATGATTININGLGAKAVTINGATAITTGILIAGGTYRFTYDATEFVTQGPFNSTATAVAFSGITSGVNSTAAMSVAPGASFGISVNGALSAPGLPLTGTWITGGSTTTTKPYVLIEPAGTVSTGWNANGTGLGVNATSGFGGNLIDLQVIGVSKFSVSAAGSATAVFSTATSGFFGPSIAPLTANTTLNVNNSATISTANIFGVTMASNTYSATSGTSGAVRIIPTYNQLSGTAANTDLLINRTETAIGSGAQLFVSYQVAGAQKYSVDHLGDETAQSFNTLTVCNSAASPAACGSAAAGSVTIAAAATTVQVNTTAVTANSTILLMYDGSLGTRLGVTCNATEPALYGVTARTAGTSFTVTATAPITNPACFGYAILN
jgi:hypothetical protein